MIYSEKSFYIAIMNFDGYYVISGSETVCSLEKQLQASILELKEELEEQNLLKSQESRRISSVPFPRDLNYYRKERKRMMERTLQVSSAKKLVNVADVLQETLVIAGKFEYTTESLPLLIHQLIKWLPLIHIDKFMFTDEDECMETDSIESTVRKLSYRYDEVKFKENISTTSYDNFIKYLSEPSKTPIPERQQLSSLSLPSSFIAKVYGFLNGGRASNHLNLGMPIHTLKLDDFKGNLLLFMDIYKIPRAVQEKWGSEKHKLLKKPANWLPFVKLIPSKNIEQEKKWTELRQKKQIDVLLLQQSSLLKLTDPDKVIVTLKNHVSIANGDNMKGEVASSSFKQFQKTEKLWKKIYSNPEIFVLNQSELAGEQENEKSTKMPTFRASTYDYFSALRMLGLEENSRDEGYCPSKNSSYSAYLLLRHLRIRDLQISCLYTLNYLRSIQRTLTITDAGLTLKQGKLTKSCAQNHRISTTGDGTMGGGGGLGSHDYFHNTSADFKISETDFIEYSEIENHDDFYEIEGERIYIRDQQGLYIIYDEAINDFKQLEEDLLLLASFYIENDKSIRSQFVDGKKYSNTDSDTLIPENFNIPQYALMHIDRFGILLDLWTQEAAFQNCKRNLIRCYFEAYCNVFDRDEKRLLAQTITNIMFQRPRYMFKRCDYFIQIYYSECVNLQLHIDLVQAILNQQIEDDREYIQKCCRTRSNGMPHPINEQTLIKIHTNKSALLPLYLLEFHPFLALAAQIPRTLNYLMQELCYKIMPNNNGKLIAVEKLMLEIALSEWNSMQKIGLSYRHQDQKHVFFDSYIEDPLLMSELVCKNIAATEQTEKSHADKQIDSIDEIRHMLELVHLRSRLIDSCWEASVISKLYTSQAEALGLDECHLHMRSIYFDQASYKEDAGRPPPGYLHASIDDSVDRYLPKVLNLAILDYDNIKPAEFSFSSNYSICQEIDQKNQVQPNEKTCKLSESKASVTPQKTVFSESFVSVQFIKALEDFSPIRNTFFTVGIFIVADNPADSYIDRRKSELSIDADFKVMSPDGQEVLNIWYLPHCTEILTMFSMLSDEDCIEALTYLLQIVSALHDILQYLIGHYRLGNRRSLIFAAQNADASATWGGLEGIKTELKEIMTQVQSLSCPTDPKQVVELLTARQEVAYLEFDIAVRYSLVETFLLSGNRVAFEAVNMNHGLTVLSNVPQESVFNTYLRVPEPLEAYDSLAVSLYPWRSFLGRNGPFPGMLPCWYHVSQNMQLCVASLKELDKLAANGEISGVSLQLEDIILSEFPGFRQFTSNLEPTWKTKVTNSLYRNILAKETNLPSPSANNFVVPFADFPLQGIEEDSSEEDSTVEVNVEPTDIYLVLRCYLILWKQLEVLKKCWKNNVLCLSSGNPVTDYQEFCKIYRKKILFPVLQNLDQKKYNRTSVVGFANVVDPLVTPPSVSDFDVKGNQLVKLLESFECHMIKKAIKEINKDLSLAIAERAREEIVLPTDLWRKRKTKGIVQLHCPNIMSNFRALLLSKPESVTSTTMTFSHTHLNAALQDLAQSVVAREKLAYESYTNYYENMMKSFRNQLYQKEQEIRKLQDDLEVLESNLSNEVEFQLADKVFNLLMEITAVHSKISRIYMSNKQRNKEIRNEVKREYSKLIEDFFAASIQLREKFDIFRNDLTDEVLEIITTTRKHVIEEMEELKLKYHLPEGESDLHKKLQDAEEIHELQTENNQLNLLILKLRAINIWNRNFNQANYMRAINSLIKEVESLKKTNVELKLITSEESRILKQQLVVLRKELSILVQECSSVKNQLNAELNEKEENMYTLQQNNQFKHHIELFKQEQIDNLVENQAWRIATPIQQRSEPVTPSYGYRSLLSKPANLRNVDASWAKKRNLSIDVYDNQVCDHKKLTQRPKTVCGRFSSSALGQSTQEDIYELSEIIDSDV
ncbi:Hypothetical predicted protein [Octopus vulgaris]|uniref:DUF4549 domain-containing protein n=1 Tax=Octopus vulgaris TaxID=6645 RepID=A0AA36ASH4_OCTVU|nr:Hypothetical predicted protein [Octopus vulgaris]